MSTVCLAAENTLIRLIVPWPAGSTIDLTARYLQPSLEKSLNSRVLVENRPGANGQVAVEYSLQSRDSTIFILDQMNQYLNPLLQPKLNYDPNRDLLPLALVSELNFVLVVNPRVPAKNLQELIALARARPGGLTFAHTGEGSGTYMALKILKHLTKTEIYEVGYKGGPQTMIDVVNGNVDGVIHNLGLALPMIQSGKVRALAKFYTTPSNELTDKLESAESLVPGLRSSVSIVLFAVKNTNPDLVQQVRSAANQIISNSEFQHSLRSIGNTPGTPLTSAQLEKQIEDTKGLWFKSLKVR